MTNAFRSYLLVIVFFLTSMYPSLWAQEPVDYRMIEKIRDEGFNRSQVMDIVWHLTDVYGPRLANSPSYDQATQWAKQKFEEFGVFIRIGKLKNSHNVLAINGLAKRLKNTRSRSLNIISG